MTPPAPRPLVVVAASGHAKVVIDAARAAGRTVLACFDDNPALHGTTLLGVPVEGGSDAVPAFVEAHDAELVLAIGVNRVRQRVVDRLASEVGTARWATVIHPSAVVAESAEVGEGAVVFAGAVVQPDARIGAHAILNTGASVDHDSVVGAFAHIAPGARLAGGVMLGEGAFVGIGACVIPGRTIGAWAVVGAGAAVVRDLAPGGTYVGVPAQSLSPSFD